MISRRSSASIGAVSVTIAFQLSCFLRQMKKLRLVRHARAYSTLCMAGAPISRRPRHKDQSKPWRAYLAIEAWAAAIFALTASRLKLAPFCIGGNSIAVMASFSTCC